MTDKKMDSGRSGGGDSGGAYPNPHTGKKGKRAPTHGGQTEIDYYGTGQLGDEKVPGEDNPNATTGG